MAKKLTFEEFSNRTEFSRTLSDVEPFLVWRYVAMHYFERSSAWICGKLAGKDGNGGVTDFTAEEKAILKGALVDMANRLRIVADSIAAD